MYDARIRPEEKINVPARDGRSRLAQNTIRVVNAFFFMTMCILHF
jgi:hypothetical protein